MPMEIEAQQAVKIDQIIDQSQVENEHSREYVNAHAIDQNISSQIQNLKSIQRQKQQFNPAFGSVQITAKA